MCAISITCVARRLSQIVHDTDEISSASPGNLPDISRLRRERAELGELRLRIEQRRDRFRPREHGELGVELGDVV